MSQLLSKIRRLYSVCYDPNVKDKSFLDRLAEQSGDGLEVKVAVPSDRESQSYFGVRLSHRGLQAVWVDVENDSERPYRLDFYCLDPAYYMPLEAAYVCHYSLGKRLLSFGLLSWLFLPLLPLVPFKLASARAANKRMSKLFKRQSFRFGPIPPGERRSGFVFTHLDEGTKNLDLVFTAAAEVRRFSFSLEVPGLDIRETNEPVASDELREVRKAELAGYLAGFARCTTNKAGTIEGDPLNLVVIGDRVTIRQCFGGRWDEAESITFETCLKTARAFLLDAGYRYSPVSSLFVNGQMQTLALQMARASINERIHLRLWPTELSFQQQPVWIGQISRDIGIRFTPKTWNLTTHRIDPDVDEAREYVLDNLVAARRIAAFGYVSSVEAAAETAPRHNLTGDPYFTDGRRAVLMLARASTDAAYVDWSVGNES